MAGEQSFKAVINDTKPSAKGRSFSVEITGSNFNHFLGKKIGDSVEGMFVGEGDSSLNGYKLQITGGSDKTGRPMRSELEGGNVKSILITASTGYKGKRYVKKNSKIYRYKYNGLRRRRNLRGNTISTESRQLNLKVLEYGKKSLGSILGDEEDVPIETASNEEE